MGTRYKRPVVVWMSWCERCGKFVSAGRERRDVLGDCSFCPPNTPTEALRFFSVSETKK